MFTENIYALIRDGCQRSAAIVVPDLMQILKPASVTDYGCGEGHWLAAFADHGCEIQGIDSGHTDTLAIPRSRYCPYDLNHGPDPLLPATDLTLCLETAEHLAPDRADWLVNVLCGTSRVILFSAAIPGQGGHGHLNEQWPDYWHRKFAARCYQGTGALRWTYWDQVPEIEPWYAQNLWLYAETTWIGEHPDVADLWHEQRSGPNRVVHPAFWEARP